MTRRLFLPLLVAPLLAESEDVLDILTAIASALSEGNAIAFLKAFDSGMPGYSQIETGVTALTEQAEIVCSIDILTGHGDAFNHSAEVDWFLQLRSKAPGGPLERRRQIVKVQFAKRNKKWKIVGLDPASILRPLEPHTDRDRSHNAPGVGRLFRIPIRVAVRDVA